jgi:hypothetical protein
MEKNPVAVRLGFSVHPHSNHRATQCLTLIFGLVGAMACGTAEDASFETNPEFSTHPGALSTLEDLTGSGLAVNGLAVNGLAVNGLSMNGLAVNGLAVNGMSTQDFKSWFNGEPARNAQLMKYVVACALPQGQSRTFTSTVTGQTYTWPGRFGLAPGWSAGFPISEPEQQIITACLAVHANKFGLQIAISMLGRGAFGQEIPYTANELATYSENEACFFGNAFNDEGIFAANDRNFLRPGESTVRACGLSAKNESSDCLPIVHVGSCKDFCTLDASRTYYTSCTYNGVTYRPLTTRILPKDVYQCGDGVCQFTESCGTGGTYDSCGSDCGPCQ